MDMKIIILIESLISPWDLFIQPHSKLFLKVGANVEDSATLSPKKKARFSVNVVLLFVPNKIKLELSTPLINSILGR